MQGLRLKTLVMCLATTLPIIAHAYEPSVTALVMGGSYAGGWGDGLVPVYSNDQQMVYADLQFSGASTNAGILSAGGGYRQQITSEGILGGYLFYDRERSASESYYNVISPGVEYLTPTWQYRVNYYLPVGNKTNLTSQGWADEFGNTQFVEFSGHSEMDRMQYNYESLSYGADFTVGYRFQADNRWQVNLSPYAFNRDNANAMMGANAQLDFYTNDSTTIFIGDGYDNANHNRVFAGVSFTFGAHNNDATTSNLMNSPVYRNLDVNTTSNGLPVSESTTFSDQQALEANNLYFVNSDATGSTEDGTYENPYTDIDQISGASSDAQIRVEDTVTDYNSATTITLSGTQTIAGYTDDYKTIATGSDRPTIYSEGLLLNGDNSVTGLQLLGYGTADSAGITINGNATIEDVVVGSLGSADSYQTGVQLNSNASALIESSTVNAYSEGDVGVNGVRSSGDSLIINKSTINAVCNAVANIDPDVGYAGGATGVNIGAMTGDVEINNSTVTASSNSAYNTVGVAMSFMDNDVVITDSVITANGYINARAVSAFNMSGDLSLSDAALNASTTENTGTAAGVFYSGGMGDVEIANSTIDVTANGGSAVGVDNESSAGDMSITNSTINVASTGAAGGATGIFNFGNSGDLTVTDSTINVSSAFNDSSSTSYGIYIGSQNSGATQVTNSVISVADSNSGTVIGVKNDEDLADGDYVPGVVALTNTTVDVTGSSAQATQGDVVIN